MNRLAGETSPYLLQHARNPVDWYPWGEEALARAKAEDKPILLSIGYAACHWCHVMERESFEDAATARVMNERFICIKVDREERPDLDSIYMSAVQALTGHGGWPMTVFLTPDGRPFYGGTYFPPEDRHGMPSFTRVLNGVSEAWTHQRDDLERQGTEITMHVARAADLRAVDEELSEETLYKAAYGILERADTEWGGFGSGMKFPQPATLEFLLRMSARGYPGAIEHVTLTLDRMARGGIFDQVGGGFHRYAVDRIWLVPHFEKMLYDNAQLLRLYARAFQVTGSPLYRDTAIATAEYLLREMRHPDGAFFSSQDADSEGVEGKFFVWSFEEFIALAGDDMPLAIAAFAASGTGNWEGTNVLWRPHPDEEVAADTGATVEEVGAVVARVRARLLDAREKRVHPAADDKILASWNGLAIGALAEAGRIFGLVDFVDAAERAAAFVLDKLRPGKGRLLRSWRDGRAGAPGFLDDYAMMADACLTLYETRFDQRWYDEALALARAIPALFGDADHGGFYDTGSDVTAPIVRPRDITDNAVPSGNAAAADVLLRLAALEGDSALEATGTSFLLSIQQAMADSPHGFGAALGALDRAVAGATEIAIVGQLDSDEARALLEVANRGYLPNRVLAAGPEGTARPPLLRDRPAREGLPTAYLCRNFTCDAPTTDPGTLAQHLAE